MLILLLGAGRGFQYGVEKEFKKDATNSIWIRSGQTSIPYDGYPRGRKISFVNQDYDNLTRGIDNKDYIAGRYFMWGGNSIVYQGKTESFRVLGIHPDHRFLENTQAVKGRLINHRDQEENRKVANIGIEVDKALFKGENAIGKIIIVNDVPFIVSGVFTDEGEPRQQQRVYIPISTLQSVFGKNQYIHQLAITTKSRSVEASHQTESEIRRRLARTHRFDSEDKRAVNILNTLEQFERFLKLFRNIRYFIWFVGIGSIIAGIVGVSNIMLIVVKERTKEIGIRKSLGATPYAIIEMVLLESILITLVSGYLGLVAGVGALEAVKQLLPNTTYFSNPEVDFGIALGALGILVVAGSIAGYFPAKHAADIEPINALRSE